VAAASAAPPVCRLQPAFCVEGPDLGPALCAGRSKGWGIVEFETPEEVRNDGLWEVGSAWAVRAHQHLG
jgi:hypothetical protein